MGIGGKDELIIVGGGPSGLVTGINLLNLGFETLVIEKESQVGIPQHCSGIVSKRFIDSVGLPHNLIVRRLYGVKLYIGNEEYSFRSTTPKAYVIDRFRYEKWLGDKYMNKGGKIKFNTKVDDLKTIRSNTVIDSRGAFSYIKKRRSGVLPAIQNIVSIPGIESSLADYAHIYVDRQRNPYFFTWAVNIGGERWKVGTAGFGNIRDNIINMVKLLNADNPHLEDNLYGFVIVGGPFNRFRYGNVILIGDSAGQVKPTTGGGLLYHVTAAKFLASSIYEKQWRYEHEFYKMFGKEIRLQKMVRNIFLNLSNQEVKELAEVITDKELAVLLMSMGDMDYHVTSLLRILKDLWGTRSVGRFSILKSVFKSLISI